MKQKINKSVYSFDVEYVHGSIVAMCLKLPKCYNTVEWNTLLNYSEFIDLSSKSFWIQNKNENENEINHQLFWYRIFGREMKIADMWNFVVLFSFHFLDQSTNVKKKTLTLYDRVNSVLQLSYREIRNTFLFCSIFFSCCEIAIKQSKS